MSNNQKYSYFVRKCCVLYHSAKKLIEKQKGFQGPLKSYITFNACLVLDTCVGRAPKAHNQPQY